jgi:hypothetical protein
LQVFPVAQEAAAVPPIALQTARLAAPAPLDKEMQAARLGNLATLAAAAAEEKAVRVRKARVNLSQARAVQHQRAASMGRPRQEQAAALAASALLLGRIHRVQFKAAQAKVVFPLAEQSLKTVRTQQSIQVQVAAEVAALGKPTRAPAQVAQAAPASSSSAIQSNTQQHFLAA